MGFGVFVGSGVKVGVEVGSGWKGVAVAVSVGEVVGVRVLTVDSERSARSGGVRPAKAKTV